MALTIYAGSRTKLVYHPRVRDAVGMRYLMIPCLTLQREADIANNRGIAFEARLQAMPLDASANTRGIKRAADKASARPYVWHVS